MKNAFFTNYIIIYSVMLVSLTSYAQAPNWEWAKSAAGGDLDRALSVATDGLGNSYVVGFFQSSTISFDTTTLINDTLTFPSLATDNIFITKYDANGHVLWSKSAGGFDQDRALSIAVDTLGNSYIVGYVYSPTIAFDSIPLTNMGNGSNGKMFIVKYDTNGNALWAKSTGGGHSTANAVAVDASGNSYITGFFQYDVTFGNITLIDSLASVNAFVAKYDGSGNELWAKSIDGESVQSGTSIAIDNSGNSYIVGYSESYTTFFDSIIVTDTGVTNAFIAKYDVSGNIVWAKSGGAVYGNSITIDSFDNIYVTGEFSGTNPDFGSTTLINAGVSDIFVVKYDNNGNVLWAKSAGGDASDNGASIALDILGNCYVTGYFYSAAIAFDSVTLADINVNNDDLFIVKYSPIGNVLWAKLAVGPDVGLLEGTSIAVNSLGDVFVVGYFDGLVNFGATTLTLTPSPSYPNTDIFVTKLNPDYLAGVNSFTKNQQLQIYPNPAQQSFTVELPQQQNFNLLVYDVTGRKVYQRTNIIGTVTIDCSNFNAGVYFVKAINERTVLTDKLIKQ